MTSVDADNPLSILPKMTVETGRCAPGCRRGARQRRGWGALGRQQHRHGGATAVLARRRRCSAAGQPCRAMWASPAAPGTLSSPGGARKPRREPRGALLRRKSSRGSGRAASRTAAQRAHHRDSKNCVVGRASNETVKLRERHRQRRRCWLGRSALQGVRRRRRHHARYGCADTARATRRRRQCVMSRCVRAA
jgi:hypothetical protein